MSARDASSSSLCAALLVAASSNDVASVERLLSDGVDLLSARDADGWTPLTRAVAAGHKDVLNLLLSKRGLEQTKASANKVRHRVSLVFSAGPKPLAVFERRTRARGSLRDSVRPLSLTPSSPHFTRTPALFQLGRTALHYACANGAGTVAQMLLFYGADVCARDGSGRTSLDDASDAGHRQLAYELGARAGVPLPARAEPPVLYRADHSSLLVCWERVESDADVTAHRVCVACAPAGEWRTVTSDVAGTTTSFRLKGLRAESAYVVRVAAGSASGWGEWSAPSDVMKTSAARGGTGVSMDADTGAGVGGGSGDGDAILGSPLAVSGGIALRAEAEMTTSPIMFWGARGAGAAPSGAAIAGVSGGTSAIATGSPPPVLSRGERVGVSATRLDTARASSVGSGSSVGGRGGGGGGGATEVALGRTPPRVLSDGGAVAGATVLPRLSIAQQLAADSSRRRDARMTAGPGALKPPTAVRQSPSSSSKTLNSEDFEGVRGGGATVHVGAVRVVGGGGGRAAQPPSVDATIAHDLLRTLQIDLEDEMTRRRSAETDVSRLRGVPAALEALDADALTALEGTLEEAIKRVRGERERRMRDKLGDEQSRVICAVCLERQKTTLFLPCKHLCACAECASKIFGSKKPVCPICRADVAETLDVYA